jgi:glutamate racemase
MIGVFDSGSGGLTILNTLAEKLPDQDFLYLGDHANAPYGHRSNEQIVELTQNGVAALMDAGCALVVLACNTAAAIALRTLQQHWLETAYPDNRILGVLVPMVEALSGVPWSQEHPDEKATTQKTILLFATQKTIESNAYSDEVSKRAPNISLIGKACPGLVDAIEGGAGPKPLQGMVSGYVDETLNSEIDAVVLGCTHFPLVRDQFEAALPSGMPIYSQPELVADALSEYLARHPEFKKSGTGAISLKTTGSPSSINGRGLAYPEKFGKFESL